MSNPDEANDSATVSNVETEQIAEAVIEALAKASGTSPEKMKPLYESINPDALDELFDRQHMHTPERVEFRHQGYEVVIESDGRIEISESE